MAAEPKALFTVDAGKILAKLHLAGKTQAPNFLVVNTGIKNEKENDNPDSPGKTTFDLSSKDGKFEVCFVKLGFQYVEKIDPNQDPAVQKAEEKVDKEKDKNSKLTDDQKSVAKENQEKNKAIAKLVNGVKTDSSNDEIKAAVKDENEKRAEQKEEAFKKLKAQVIKEAGEYFKKFCGSENYKAPTEDQLVQIQLSPSIKSMKDIKIKDYVIQPIEDKELKKWQEEHAKEQNKPAVINVGFKMSYTLQIDSI